MVEQPEVRVGSSVDENQNHAVQGVAFRNAIMGPALAASRGPRGIMTYDQLQQRRRQLQQQHQEQERTALAVTTTTATAISIVLTSLRKAKR